MVTAETDAKWKKGSKKEEESSGWRCDLCSDELREPLHQRKVPATGGDDNEIHHDEHDFVAPAIRAGFSPKASLPNENLLLNRAEHD